MTLKIKKLYIYILSRRYLYMVLKIKNKYIHTYILSRRYLYMILNFFWRKSIYMFIQCSDVNTPKTCD